MHEGLWEGRRLLSTEWIAQSTQVGAIQDAAWDSGFKDIGLWNYGYCWWLVSREDGDYLALGKDGQYIYVNPTKKLVVVRLGWNAGKLLTGQWISLFQHLAREVR